MIAAPFDAVEIPGRLIGKDQGWPIDDASRYCHALALTAGKLVRQVGGARRKTDSFQRGFSATLTLSTVNAGAKGGDLDILIGGQGRKQIEVLENDADLGTAQIGPFLGRRDRLAIPSDAPSRRRHDAAHQHDERGLSASAGANDGD